MQRIFNSGFELEPRVILIANTYPLTLFSEDMFVALDFMAVYSHEFLSEAANLHGDNCFKFSEIVARTQSVREAIKRFVCEGFLEVVLEDGFYYRISDIGKKYAESLESTYAGKYRNNLLSISQRYSNYNEQSLSNLIREKAVMDSGEGM